MVYLVESNEHYYLKILDQKTREDIRRRHSGPRRFYHTWDHPKAMFALMDLFDEALECIPAVALAVAFHDITYDPRRKDNEIRSASVMRRMCKGLNPLWTERAEAMILATANHSYDESVWGGEDIDYFLDLDMSILGAEEAVYQEYSANVRKEFGHLSDHKWAIGRAEFLGSMKQRLKTKSLYYTEWGRVNFHDRAVVNISQELENLTNTED